MTIRRKISAIGTGLLLAMGLVITVGAAPALAATGTVITTDGDVLHVWSGPSQPHSSSGLTMVISAVRTTARDSSDRRPMAGTCPAAGRTRGPPHLCL
jgi:hypothetical protein